MRKSVVLAAVFALAFGWASAAGAATITFDPDGPGALNAVTIDLFDVAPGNSITQRVTASAQVSTQSQVFFQANLSVAKLGDANQYSNNTGAAGTQDSHKFLAGLPVHVAAVVGDQTQPPSPANPITLSFDFGNSATNFFRIYAGTSPGMNLTGLGFPAPADTLILEGTWIDDDAFRASFTATGTSNRLDQFGDNNYPGVGTIVGGGTFAGNVDVTFANPLYFPGLSTDTTIFVASSKQSLPYTQANPSDCFTNGVVACAHPGAPEAVGAVNGVTGPDTMLETDASFSFLGPQAPEPALLALFGLGLFGAGAIRRRQMRKLQ